MSTTEEVPQRVNRLFSIRFRPKEISMKIAQNRYNEFTNKQGIINMMVAHNACISEIMIDKLNQPELQLWDPSLLPYTEDRQGASRLRKAISDFLTEELSIPELLDPNKMIVMNGVTPLLSMIAFTLGDEGDTFLTPSPMYGGIPRNFLFQAGVQTFPVYLSSKPEADGQKPYELTIELLESALEEAKKKGHKVKALFLINPSNPLGTVYTKSQVFSYLEFCMRHDIHCIIDEIYICSIYDPTVQGSSVLSFHPDELPNKNKTHVLWGFSKEFGMPGSPVGVVYSWNTGVLANIERMVAFHQVPHFIQVTAAKLLEDKEWIKSVHQVTNKRLLRESAQIAMSAMDELSIPYVKPCSGLFLWADFRKFLRESSLAAETELTSQFLDQGVALEPSSIFYYNEYGWYRIVFSVPRQQLIEGLKRIKEVCDLGARHSAETGSAHS